MKDFCFFGDPLIAKALIAEIGVLNIQELSFRKTKAIYRWRLTGLPFDFERFLRLKFPNFSCWNIHNEQDYQAFLKKIKNKAIKYE